MPRKKWMWLCVVAVVLALLYVVARPKPTFYEKAQTAIAHVRDAAPDDKSAVIEREMQLARSDSSGAYVLELLNARLQCEAELTPDNRKELGAMADSFCDGKIPGWSTLAAHR